MRLALRVPHSKSESLPLVLSMYRSAPMFQIETEGRTMAYVAVFPDLSLSFDLVERLIEAAAELPDVQVSIDERPVESLTKFLSVVRCYRESLAELDPQAHCARQATRIGDVGSCPDRACVSHCQFICMRCIQVVRGIGAQPVRDQLKAIAIQAEVEWCPNLRMP
ncbi:MAG: hypothetical protein E8D50_07060 [Nitrospira sp.]|nr:MAG: hypothetical protein E8D50_07060 [Nitrospira sp.]